MLLVATTPFSGLLEIFVAVPLGILCSIYGAEYAAVLRHRRHRHGQAPHRNDRPL